MSSLLAIHGPLFGARFPIMDELTLGRAPGVTVQLVDLQVSRVHASVRHEAHGYVVQDASSRNGIYVNDRRISGAHTLTPGDVLRIGSSAFLFDASERFWRARFGRGWVLAGGDEREVDVQRINPMTLEAGPLPEARLKKLLEWSSAGLEEDRLHQAVLTWLVEGWGASRGALWMARAGYPLRLFSLRGVSSVLPISAAVFDACLDAHIATVHGPLSLSLVENGVPARVSMPRSVLTVRWRFGDRHHGRVWLERDGQAGPFELKQGIELAAALQLLGASLEEASQRTWSRRRLWLERTHAHLEHLPGHAVLAHLGLLDSARSLAAHLRPVFIQGPRGMGKERVARAIHAMSPRWDSPILHLQCARLAEARARLELFGAAPGHVSGWPEGFPGKLELASGGALVLGEVAALTPSVQQSLLRALSLGEILREGGDEPVPIHLRLYVTSSRDPQRWVEDGRLRSDLLPLICQEQLILPSLEHAPFAVIPMARELIARLNLRMGKSVRGLSPGAEALLLERKWPHNLWDLEALLLRAMTLCDQEYLAREDLELAEVGPRVGTSTYTDGLRLSDTLRAVEQRLVVQALKVSRGNRTRAAQLLGMTREQLERKLIELSVHTREE